MADYKTGGRAVVTSIPMVDFTKGMRGAKSADALAKNANLITDIALPLYSGKDLPNDQRSQYPNGGRISVNLGKMTNMSPSLLATIGTQQNGRCAYTGNTPEETPVTIDTVEDMSEQNPDRKMKARVTMDLKAVAAVNDIERDAARRAKGLDPIMTGDYKVDSKNPALGRMNVRLRESVTTEGVPAMNKDRLSANLGEMAAQNYLMTTPKDPQKAGKYMVQKDDVSSVAALYASEYEKFVTKYADKACDGIKPMEKQKDGTYKAGKQPIEGTAFSSLKDMGFSPVKLDNGSIALVCTDPSSEAVDRRKGEKGLLAFDRAFNSHMSQVVSQSFESGTVARNLGAQLGVASYPATVPGSGVTMIQPSTTFDVKTFASSLTTSVECATHNEPTGPNGQKKTMEDIYGKTVLDNTRAIQDYFPDKGGSEGRDRIFEEIKAKQPAATKAFDAPDV